MNGRLTPRNGVGELVRPSAAASFIRRAMQLARAALTCTVVVSRMGGASRYSHDLGAMSVTRSRTRVGRVASAGLLAVAAVTVIIAGAAVSAPASSPATFDGGFVAAQDFPSFVANDHSACAVRFVARGLSPETAYRLRIVFADPGTTPGGSTDRGFIWNPATRRWLPPGEEDWTALPVVTTDASGSYGTSADAGWFFVKFGDVRVTGPRLLVAFLSPTGGGEVLRGTGQPVITVFAPATDGYWVHNRGVILAHDGTPQEASKRVELADGLPAVDRLALQLTEPNLCDDDGDGVDDNEGRLSYANGDTEITGDFRMAVPAAAVAWYLYDGDPPSLDASVGQGFGNTVPDTDLALETVGEAVPPSAPSSLVAKATTGKVTLTWGAADAAGTCSYLIYRWTDGAQSDPFTPVKAVVARAPAGQLDFVDTDVTAGTLYHYEVRAQDAQTNVGPRSNEATATTPVQPDLEATALVLGAVPPWVQYGAHVVLTATLRDGSGQPLSGQAVRVARWRVTDSERWTDLGPAAAGAALGEYRFVARPGVRTWYRFSLVATAVYEGTLQATSLVPRLRALGRPVVPSRVKRGRQLTVYGFARPRLADGAHDIRIQCFVRSDSGWVLKKTVVATNHSRSTSTMYRARLSLTTSGSWRLRALYPGSGPLSRFARTGSGSRATTVR
jgi:hypothetical protein